MPRTKRPVKRQETLSKDQEEAREALKKLDKLVAEQKKKIDERAKMIARNIELAFKIFVGTIGDKYLQCTVGQMKKELLLKEPARQASHDDGYNTESSAHGSGERANKPMAPPSTASRTASRRRSRSVDTSRRAPQAAARPQQRRSRSGVYRTPAYNRNAVNAYPAITPKVAPHTPLTLLRQPRQGEMVVAMTGSPVAVPTYSTMQSDEKASCNIMLQDGTMLSLKPNHLRQSQAYVPFSLMGPDVLSQIRTIKENLETIVSLGENALK